MSSWRGMMAALFVGIAADPGSAFTEPNPCAESISNASAQALDHHSLRTVHMDLLGRPPYRAEYETWLGKELPALVDQLLSSHEFWEHWHEEQLYYFLLINNF